MSDLNFYWRMGDSNRSRRERDMKYILEIKPEYEDSFKGLMILGAKDSNLFVDTLAVENLEVLNSDYINEHFSDLQDTAYQRGLDDAWEAAKKLSWAEKYGGYGDRLDKVFDRTDTFDFLEYSPNEAIEKLKAYEEKQKHDDKIEVGDEVYSKGDDVSDSGVVTWVGKDSIYAMWQDGSAGEVQKDELVKTGRHFDIASILEDMRHD